MPRQFLTTGRLLAIILCLAAAVRLYGLKWDSLAGQHPDERHITNSIGNLSWPKSWGDYFSEVASPLNPRNHPGGHFWAYGTLPTTVLRGVVDLGGVTKPEDRLLAGRVLSALADLGSVLVLFLLARTLYADRRIALLAAFLYSIAVLPVQEAHFFVVDPMANFFTMLALWLLARAWRSGRTRDYAWVGIAIGLSFSCKISGAAFGLPMGLVALLPAAGQPFPGWRRTLVAATQRCALFLVAGFLTVHLAMPDAFTGFVELAPRWLKNMREVIEISTGVRDIEYTRQWVGRTPLAWPWWNMVAWGMGLPLGLAAWLGWLAAAWQLAARRVWAHLIPVSWIATVFVSQGLIYQATLRYFLPIYAPLILLAAWLLMGGVDAAAIAGEARRWRRLLGWAAPVVVAAGTLAWVAGFLSIYRQPHTRIEASRWIYKHVPPGATLACEVWDDFLPLPLPDSPGPGIYRQIEMPLYEFDNPDKRGRLLARMNQADYIVLASQKLVDSIPRMPHRYPFTISYYEGLRDGSLGFDKVAEFKRPLNVLGIPISTRSAEEAFSVYDHPPVEIYKKSPRYDPEALVVRFNAIPLDGVTDTRYPVTKGPEAVRRAQRVRPALTESAILLPKEQWEHDQAGGTWGEMFDRTSFAARHPVLVWCGLLLLLQTLGLAFTIPRTWRLPDGGASLARPFTILLPIWLLWWLASHDLLRFGRANYWWILLAVALLAGWSVYRRRREWPDLLRARARAVGQSELVFWLAFAGFLTIRAFNPDLWHPAWGGEKPMEMTYLYGVLKSDQFPPMNPWFAGGFINYYYFGFVLCGGLIKAVGVLPEVGFNLCLATFFGLTAAGAFGAARALTPTRSVWPAAAATAFVAIFGNLFQVRFIWNRLMLLGAPDHAFTFPIVSDIIRAAHGAKRYFSGEPLSPYIADLYWVAARAIGVTEPHAVPPITEFPYWSFLYADLHPHVIALPYTLGVVTLLAAWVRSTGILLKSGLVLLLGFTLGFFWPTNSWDWPTYGALTGLTLFLVSWRRDDPGTLRGFSRAVVSSLFVFGLMLLIGYLAFRPFHQHYQPGYGAFDRWVNEGTTLRDYLFIHGFFLFVLATGFWVALHSRSRGILRVAQTWGLILRHSLPGGSARRKRRLLPLMSRHRAAFASAGVLLTALYLALLALAGWQKLTPLLVAGFTGALLLALERRHDTLRALPALMAALGFTLSLAVEYFVLSGDIGRMNTVFKFYYQVWILFALASALTLPEIFADLPRWRAPLRRLWLTGFGGLVALSLLFVLTGTPQKIRDRAAVTPPTLDGLAFAEKAQYSLRGKDFRLRPDLLAIRWLQDHIQGSPVILEMNLDKTLYSWGNRFSIHTGLPAIAGWSWHQRQQQAALRENHVDDRIAEVQRIYATTDTAEARRLMDKYNVGLVVVGELERIYAPAEGLAKFDHMGLQKIYDAEGVAIYRVPR